MSDPHAAAHHAAEPEPQLLPEVRPIARFAELLGLLLVLGAAGFTLVVQWRSGFTGQVAWGLFALLYGGCIWLAAKRTLARFGA